MAGLDSCGMGMPTDGFVAALYAPLDVFMYRRARTRDVIGGVFCGMCVLRPSSSSFGVEVDCEKWWLAVFGVLPVVMGCMGRRDGKRGLGFTSAADVPVAGQDARRRRVCGDCLGLDVDCLFRIQVPLLIVVQLRLDPQIIDLKECRIKVVGAHTIRFKVKGLPLKHVLRFQSNEALGVAREALHSQSPP